MGDWLRFDEGKTEFELLETERGAPASLRGGSPPGNRRAPNTAQAPGPVASVDENEARLRREYRRDINPDVLLRRFLLGGNVPCLVACINGMADGRILEENEPHALFDDPQDPRLKDFLSKVL